MITKLKNILSRVLLTNLPNQKPNRLLSRERRYSWNMISHVISDSNKCIYEIFKEGTIKTLKSLLKNVDNTSVI